ncbi:MAG: hypothetical protein IKF61_02170 [Firmicutes bacterium]|nr:hypothetical protein [Bacillota bacterium]MBR3260157.1 hypothetical protein [Bacillota bacterium]
MTDKSIELYNLMVRCGYQEEFAALIAKELSTEYTADRMMRYIRRGPHSLEEVADEMLAILSDRDRFKAKNQAEYAQQKINELYRDINE